MTVSETDLMDQLEMKRALRGLGIEPTETVLQQFEVMMRALRIFVDRNELRGDLWAEHEMQAALDKTREKHMRVERIQQRLRDMGAFPPSMNVPTGRDTRARFRAEQEDDALDAVNESVFTVRHILGWKGMKT